ncbi:hypothetical protein [Pseudonocardia sp. N23]|uniref:hypothetical protein n=1 Tax=Pseudonocardia sp. N23 TaxID=1987376 RepID=UPI000BFB8BEE|nr:hypothetical protein [Pseudonocardia sp. N23]
MITQTTIKIVGSFGMFSVEQVAELVEAARAAGVRAAFHCDGEFDAELCFTVDGSGRVDE